MYKQLSVERPSMLHSLILGEAVRVEKEWPLMFMFTEFIAWWGLENLTDDDWENFKTDDGKSLISRVEKMIYLYTKEIQSVEELLPSEEFMQVLDRAISKWSKDDNLLRCKAILLANQSAKEESRYSFETTFLSKKCNRTSKADGSYEVFSCPTSNMQKKYNTNTFTSAVSKLEFDISTERFKTTIKDHFQIDINGVKETVDFGGKLKIRVLTGNYDNRANLDDYDYNSIVKSNDLVYTLNKGSSVALSFPKDTDIRLEFFINPNTTLSGGDANCVGAYLGFISFSTPGYAEVTNTKKDTSGACKTFRKFSKIDDEFKKASDIYKKKYKHNIKEKLVSFS